MRTIKKNLDIFRGTYAECMAQPTIDMCFYLAWDTHQIFVGTRSGYKIAYDGGKSQIMNAIENYLNDFRRDINEEIIKKVNTEINQTAPEILKQLSDELFSGIVSDIDTLKAEMAEFAKDVSTNEIAIEGIQTAIVNINNNINNIINSINTKVLELEASISETNQRIDSVISTIESIEIPDKVSELENDSNFISVESVDTKLEGYQSKLVSGESIKTVNGQSILGSGDIKIDVDNVNLDGYAKTEDLENYVSKKGYMFTLNGNAVNQGDVVEVNSTSIEIPEGLATETFVKEYHDSNESVKYYTGDELVNLESSGSVKANQIVFCTAASENKKFKLGVMYYFNGEKFKAMAGGTVEKTKYETTVKLFISPSGSVEVSNTNYLLTVRAESVNNNNGGALATPVTISLSTGGSSELALNNQPGDTTIGSISAEVSGSSAKVITARISATAKTDDDEIDYNLVLPSSVSFEIYQPEFIRKDGAAVGSRVKQLPSENTITGSGTVEFFLKNRISALKTISAGVANIIPDSNYTVSEVNEVINNISCKYFKYTVPINLAPGETSIVIGIVR